MGSRVCDPNREKVGSSVCDPKGEAWDQKFTIRKGRVGSKVRNSQGEG